MKRRPKISQRGWGPVGKKREKVGWKSVRALRKGGRGKGKCWEVERGNFEGKSWMEKGERFEKGGPRGKVKVERWKDFFLQGKLRNTTGSSSHPKLAAACSNLSKTCDSLRFPFSDFKHF